MLRTSFEAADAGITGANFLSAAEGAAVIVTNEGNGDLTRLLPRTHIVVTGIEKVVADLDAVAVLLRLLPRSATGQEITSYVSVMSGPREREDGDGPTAFHVVLVDNGRSGPAGNGGAGRAALHPLRGLSQSLPDLRRGGRPRLWRDLSRADRGGAQSGHDGREHGASPSERFDLLRSLRRGLSGENPVAHDHAVLAGEGIFRRSCAQTRRPGSRRLGFPCEAAVALSLRYAHCRADAESHGGSARRGALLAADGRMVLGAELPSAAGPHVPGSMASAMSARDDILSSIRARPRPMASKPDRYPAPGLSSDLVTLFAEKARAVFAEVQLLDREDQIPAAIAGLLRARNLAPAIHLPPNSDLASLAWDRQLSVEHCAPGPDDTAVSTVPFGIAETGTLVQPARDASPASWHFRPGFEIAILRQTSIVAHFEDVLAKLRTERLPATVNLITGPSRTADIEQTLELGAHGPKALTILIVRD